VRKCKQQERRVEDIGVRTLLFFPMAARLTELLLMNGALRLLFCARLFTDTRWQPPYFTARLALIKAICHPANAVRR